MNAVEGAGEGHTIFITGYARLPQGISATQLYSVLGIGVEVDPRTEVILNADVTLATETGRSFFKKLVIGYCLGQGIEPLVQKLEARYHGSARKTIIAALRVIHQRYVAFKTGMPVTVEE